MVITVTEISVINCVFHCSNEPGNESILPYYICYSAKTVNSIEGSKMISLSISTSRNVKASYQKQKETGTKTTISYQLHTA